jgi:hypothetical protein
MSTPPRDAEALLIAINLAARLRDLRHGLEAEPQAPLYELCSLLCHARDLSATLVAHLCRPFEGDIGGPVPAAPGIVETSATLGGLRRAGLL